MPGRLVADHRIALVYECRGAGKATVAALAAADFQAGGAKLVEMGLCAPERLAASHPRSLAGRAIWTWQSATPSADLHPAVRTALGGIDDARAGWFRLADHARNLLAGLYRGEEAVRNDTLRLALTPATRRRLGDRLGDAASVAIAVEDITFHGFRTGIGLVVVLASLAPGEDGLDADLLTEAMPILADDRRDPALFFGDGAAAPERRFRFGSVVDALLTKTGLMLERRHRVHSYVTAVFESDLPAGEARDLAHRLSRHYSLAYAPPPDHAGTELLQPFANILHAASLEGAATIVSLNNGTAAMPVEFLRDWLSTAFRPTYLPIHLLAYHEHLALLELAQASAVDIDPDRFSDEEVGALRLLSARFLAFRLRYRVTQPSRVTMHNQFHESLRRALGMQALAEKVAHDVAEVEFRLTQIMREREEKAQAALAEEARKRRELDEERAQLRKRRWRFYAPIASLCVAFVTMLNFLDKAKSVFAELLPEGLKARALAGLKGVTGSTGLESWVVAHGGATLALLLSVVFALVAYKFARAHEESALHVAHEAEEEGRKEIVFEAGHKPHADHGHGEHGAAPRPEHEQTAEDPEAVEREKGKTGLPQRSGAPARS